MTISPERIAELKAAHPHLKLHLISAPDVEAVVKSPSRESYIRFKDRSAEPAGRYQASEAFIVECAIEPAPAQMLALLEERPGLVDTFVGELLEISGVSAKGRNQKL